MCSPFLCAKEVAQLLSRSEKWVYQNKHLIPGHFVIGKSHFWKREALLNAPEAPRKVKVATSSTDRHGLL
jgi:predicted DNA-binding transcriptional regulator AlpA